MCGATAGRTSTRRRQRRQGGGDPGHRLARRRAGVAGLRAAAGRTGEFTAEVPTSATGQFRFFAAPGAWTLRVLAPGASVDRAVHAAVGEVADLAITV